MGALPEFKLKSGLLSLWLLNSHSCSQLYHRWTEPNWK